MTKYIPKYHWPNGFTCKLIGEVWAFSPREMREDYQRGVAKFVVYGRTPEEAEELAHKKINGIAYTPPNLSEPVGDALTEHKIKMALGKRATIRTIIRKTKLSRDCVVKFLEAMVKKGVLSAYKIPYTTDNGEAKHTVQYRFNTHTINSHKNSSYSSTKKGIETRRRILTVIKDLTKKGKEATVKAISGKLKMCDKQIRKGLNILSQNGSVKSEVIPGRRGTLLYYITGRGNK